MKAFKEEILALVTKETEGTTKELGELNAKIGGVDGKVMFINKKVRRGQGIHVEAIGRRRP